MKISRLNSLMNSINKVIPTKIIIRITALLASALLILSASACSSGNTDDEDDKDSKIEIVTTIFPIYDWVRKVAGDSGRTEVTMLLDSGTDLHSFQPTVSDIAKISNCDIFIYVGGESDEWVDDALKESVNPDMKVISLIELLGSGAKEEEIKEGMEAADDDKDKNDNKDDEDIEYDEHVWLSLKNAEFFTDAIAEALSEADPADTMLYENNARNYKALLSSLDAKYTEAAADASVKTLLFADRFPFRYMTDDYGLDYYAAFEGCSAETEASFETIAFLTKKLDELDLKHVIVTESSDKKIADTIIENSDDKDREILTLNSMQSVTGSDVKNGADYLDYMEENLINLRKAFEVSRIYR